MFKPIVVMCALIACAAAKPGLIGAPFAYTAPGHFVAAHAPFVIATSSQLVARTHNGIVAAPLAHVAPLAAYSAPIAARYAAAAGPLAYNTPWAFAPSAYAAHAAPLHYAASAPLIL